MIAPRRPNTLITGDVAAPGTTQVGIPPDIERISPWAPGVSIILFHERLNPLLKVRIDSTLVTGAMYVLVILVSSVPFGVVYTAGI